MRFFIAQPGVVIPFMSAVNSLVKLCRARCKSDREKAKIEIIRALGRLIREGRLVRVRRKNVRVNEAQVPHEPIIPFDEFKSSKRNSLANSVGSTAAMGAINPAIFV